MSKSIPFFSKKPIINVIEKQGIIPYIFNSGPGGPKMAGKCQTDGRMVKKHLLDHSLTSLGTF